MGNHPAFEWDSKGISAYWHQVDETGKTISINNGKYVRFDDKGLYGIIEDGKTPDISNANFALTWDGLKIKLPDKGKSNEVINVNDKFIVYGDGSIKANDGDFTGTIHAMGGEFTGTVKAAKFEGASSGEIIGPAIYVPSKTSPNFSVDENGNVTMKGSINMSEGSITWSASSSPIRYRFSTSISGPWHETMDSSDMYRQDSIDGGKTWGSAYQFRGKDGQNGADGSDANVPSYIEIQGIDFTNIGNNYIKSPKIYGGQFYGETFNVIANSSGGSFNLYGQYEENQYHFLEISYHDGGVPYVNFFSPKGAQINIGTTNPSMASNIHFMGNVDFRSASVSGITATFA